MEKEILKEVFDACIKLNKSFKKIPSPNRTYAQNEILYASIKLAYYIDNLLDNE